MWWQLDFLRPFVRFLCWTETHVLPERFGRRDHILQSDSRESLIVEVVLKILKGPLTNPSSSGNPIDKPEISQVDPFLTMFSKIENGDAVAFFIRNTAIFIINVNPREYSRELAHLSTWELYGID